jgi:hypothetical protein
MSEAVAGRPRPQRGGFDNRDQGAGRPRGEAEIESLVVRIAVENHDWGYTRNVGALSNFGTTWREAR